MDVRTRVSMTQTITDHCSIVYDTTHDKGRVKVAIHEPMPAFPSSSPHFAGRTPLHFVNSKKKHAAHDVPPWTITKTAVSKLEMQKERFVLESSVASPSPFFSPDPVKLEVARIDYRKCFELE